MKRLYILSLTVLTLVCFSASAQVINGTYAIKNVKTGMLLRIKDANGKNGTPLVAYSPVNWKCMTWDFKHIDGNTYQLQNLFTHKTFQTKSTPEDGSALEQQPFKAEDTGQQYEFETVAKNTFMIRLKGTALYITPSDEEGAVNSPIVLAKKTNNRLQQWSIYEQSPTM